VARTAWGAGTVVVLGGLLAVTLLAVVLPRLATASGPDVPPLPGGLSAVPLGTPAAPPSGEGGFAVLATQPGTADAVGWDPCRPVRYVVNPAERPSQGQYLFSEAVAELRRVTGLVFVEEGVTGEVPLDERPGMLPEYGPRWAPVLVAWSEPGVAPGLAGDIAGFAGPVTVDGEQPDSSRFVSGQVVLDGPQLAEMAAGPAGLARARAVLLHELAHLVGLDHVDDPKQLMYPATTPLVVDLADGDLRGLAAVSGRPCRTDF